MYFFTIKAEFAESDNDLRLVTPMSRQICQLCRILRTLFAESPALRAMSNNFCLNFKGKTILYEKSLLNHLLTPNTLHHGSKDTKAAAPRKELDGYYRQTFIGQCRRDDI